MAKREWRKEKPAEDIMPDILEEEPVVELEPEVVETIEEPELELPEPDEEKVVEDYAFDLIAHKVELADIPMELRRKVVRKRAFILTGE